MSAVIEYTCKKHPKYQGKTEPRTKCAGCNVVYAYAASANLYTTNPSRSVKIERVEQLP